MNKISLKTKLVEQLKVEDTILACIEIENNSRKIEVEYEYKIYKIVKEIGLENFPSIWRFFKAVDDE